MKILLLCALCLGAAVRADDVADIVAGLADTEKPEAGKDFSAKQLAALKSFKDQSLKNQVAVVEKLADQVESKDDGKTTHMLPAITQLLSETKSALVRSRLTRRLRVTVAKHESNISRVNAVWILGEMKDAGSLETILESTLHDRRVDVRKEAGKALAKLGEAGGFKPFLDAALTPRPHIALLEKMQDTDGDLPKRIAATVPLLVEEMKDKTTSLQSRWLATTLLGFTKSKDAVAPLIERMRDTREAFVDLPSNQISYNLRIQAIASLMELGDREALKQKEVFEAIVRNFQIPGVTNDEATRAEFGRLLGWTHDEKALPILLEAIDNKKEHYPEQVRAGAGAGLAELGFSKPLGKTLIEKLMPYIENPSGDVQAWALESLEYVRENLEEAEQKKLDERVRAAMRARAKKTDFCALACKLVKEAPKWADEKFWELPENLEPDHEPSTWQLAMKSLTLTFIAKAKFCGKDSQTVIDSVYADLLGRDGKLEAWAKKVREKGVDEKGVPINPNTVYAKVFYPMLLRELLTQGTKLKKDEKEKLQLALTTMEKALNKTLQTFTSGGEGHPFRGSLMHTFAFSTALLMDPTPPKEAGDGVADMIQRFKDPATVAYYPSGEAEEARGAAIRSVTFQTATIQLAATPEERVAAIDRTVKALGAMKEHVWTYRAHSTRSGTHGFLGYRAPKHGIAPYYTWANLPYVTASLQSLDGEVLTDAQRKIVDETREEVAAVLTSLVQPGGLFTTPSKSTYPAARVWANALGGLALLPLIKQCDGVKIPKPFRGVLVPELMEARRPKVKEKKGEKDAGKGKSH